MSRVGFESTTSAFELVTVIGKTNTAYTKRPKHDGYKMMKKKKSSMV
jgi:cell division protein FtsI/penicillin-binding protein 2